MTAEMLAKNLPQWLESKELVDMPYSTMDPETGIIKVCFSVRYKKDPSPVPSATPSDAIRTYRAKPWKPPEVKD